MPARFCDNDDTGFKIPEVVVFCFFKIVNEC